MLNWTNCPVTERGILIYMYIMQIVNIHKQAELTKKQVRLGVHVSALEMLPACIRFRESIEGYCIEKKCNVGQWK